MQYMGGKYRIARFVEEAILGGRDGRTRYVEPFLGGAATFSRLAQHFDAAEGYDVVPDLVMMWQDAIAGWIPPTLITEAEYALLRTAEPSGLRGFVGFGCSFGGKWFGGYARSRNGVAPGMSYAATSSRTVTKQAASMRHAQIALRDYRDVRVDQNTVVYADPPYAGTTGYAAAGSFDADEFWSVARGWVRDGAHVLVSEHSAPDDWGTVWERPLASYLRGDQVSGARKEALFAPAEACIQAARTA